MSKTGKQANDTMRTDLATVDKLSRSHKLFIQGLYARDVALHQKYCIKSTKPGAWLGFSSNAEDDELNVAKAGRGPSWNEVCAKYGNAFGRTPSSIWRHVSMHVSR